MFEIFKKAGIRFNYGVYAAFPQIPYVQDVLFVLLLSPSRDAHNYYSEFAANWSPYIENLTLVAAAVANQVLYMERYDEAKARKIIGEAIMDLCPSEAKCLFNDAFVAAQEASVGRPAPSRHASREEILRACGCSKCKQQISNDAEHRF